MATFGFLGREAGCLSSSTVDIIDSCGIAEFEVFLADEGVHCLDIVLEAGCRVVGGAGAGKVEGGLKSSGQQFEHLIVL